jgi:polysaccharide biosynthesis transport protein
MRETSTSNTAAAAGQRATAREFFAVVFRRRWLIIGLFLATTLTVLAVAFTTPAVYVSSGRVLVRRGEEQSVLIPERHLMNDWETDLGNEVETVKSTPVLLLAQSILDERARHGGPKLTLKTGQVDAEVMGKSNVVGIAYQDGNPDVAQKVCDALIQAYIQYRQGSQLAYPRAFFDSQISAATKELNSWSERRRDFSDRSGVVDLNEQKRNLLSLEAVLEQKRTEFTSELAGAQSEQRIMRQLQANPAIDLPTIGEPYSNESALTEIKRRVVEQEGRIATLRERYQEDAPELASALVTLTTLRDMLKREVEARLQMSRSRMEVTQSRLAVIEHDLGDVRTKLATMPSKELTLTEMDLKISEYKKRLDELNDKSDQAKIRENTSPALIVYVLSPAGAPTARNARDYIRLALAPAFSIVIGIGLAFFIDGLDLTVHTAGQAEAELELPVLAAITERRRSGSR